MPMMAASAAYLKELDLENIQLLSDELLAQPSPYGVVGTKSLLTTPDPEACRSAVNATVSGLFYGKPDKLYVELRDAIRRAAIQGEDYVVELSSQLCMSLQVWNIIFLTQ